MASQSPASLLFTQPLIVAQIKENLKTLRHWPMCGEFTGGRWIPRKKWPVTGKMFPFDDVIMRCCVCGPGYSMTSDQLEPLLVDSLWPGDAI